MKKPGSFLMGLPVLALLLVVLGGCGQMKILQKADPDRVPVAESAASKLRGQQSIVLNNAYKVEKQEYLMTFGRGDYFVDLMQFTDAAITLLGREMTKKGITIAPATKSVTLRAHTVRTSIGFFSGTGSLVVEAEYGDGTKSTIKAQATSYDPTAHAFDGALALAVGQLLSDERFLAYVNK